MRWSSACSRRIGRRTAGATRLGLSFLGIQSNKPSFQEFRIESGVPKADTVLRADSALKANPKADTVPKAEKKTDRRVGGFGKRASEKARKSTAKEASSAT